MPRVSPVQRFSPRAARSARYLVALQLIAPNRAPTHRAESRSNSSRRIAPQLIAPDGAQLIAPNHAPTRCSRTSTKGDESNRCDGWLCDGCWSWCGWPFCVTVRFVLVRLIRAQRVGARFGATSVSPIRRGGSCSRALSARSARGPAPRRRRSVRSRSGDWRVRVAVPCPDGIARARQDL